MDMGSSEREEDVGRCIIESTMKLVIERILNELEKWYGVAGVLELVSKVCCRWRLQTMWFGYSIQTATVGIAITETITVVLRGALLLLRQSQ